MCPIVIVGYKNRYVRAVVARCGVVGHSSKQPSAVDNKYKTTRVGFYITIIHFIIYPWCWYLNMIKSKMFFILSFCHCARQINIWDFERWNRIKYLWWGEEDESKRNFFQRLPDLKTRPSPQYSSVLRYATCAHPNNIHLVTSCYAR